MTLTPQPPRIAPATIRYIKLGSKGAWFERCLTEGEVHFSDTDVPRHLADDRGFAAIREHYRSIGRTPAKASDLTREIEAFFTLGSDCLWITFGHGVLWWAFADPQVYWLGGDGLQHGLRMRRTLDGWHCKDLAGRTLDRADLSGRLTKVEGYRQTICQVEDGPYLVNRINVALDPLSARGRDARSALAAVVSDVIGRLHPADFEIMTDLIFSRSGWRRISEMGRLKSDVDMVLEDSISGQRAFVQVKSGAGQQELDRCMAWFESSPHDHMYFVCHSPEGALSTRGRKCVSVWTGSALAFRALDAGLYNWLMDRAG